MPTDNTEINAMPTKSFFVDMFVRDIPLEQAILDLVDNCIDGAKRIRGANRDDLKKCWIEIKLGKKEFRITDNCGGFDSEIARNYAFRFGRPAEQKPLAHSIGQFGIGMKRALFKFGSRFAVRSATTKDEWAIDIDVTKWVLTPDWQFPWDEFESERISKRKPGTEIVVTELRPEVAARFATDRFVTTIVQLIKSKHRQFVSEGLSISVNGQHVNATNLYLLVKDNALRPGIETRTFAEAGKGGVQVRIIVAVGQSLPREAGWYVVCNGRIILEADRRPATGWGAFEDGSGKLAVPVFHNQFARFRGIVSFDSEDSSRIPWNTTKDDVDTDNPMWQLTLRRMVEMMRPVVTFLNELDADIEEHGRKHSPMLDVVEKATTEEVEGFTRDAQFRAPTKASSAKTSKTVKIQYSKSTKDVEFLKDALDVASASAVGEKTFDLVLIRQRR